MKAYSRSVRTATSSSFQDVNFLGPWHFTLQEDTPLYWLDNGTPLQRYLLKVQVRASYYPEDAVVAGFTFHSSYGDGMLEPESGVWFWVDIRDGKKTYCIGGADLETPPERIPAGRAEVEEGDGGMLHFQEDWKVLVQGSTGCIFPESRPKRRVKFASRQCSGQLAFFNYSCTARDALEVDFRNVSITLLNVGAAASGLPWRGVEPSLPPAVEEQEVQQRQESAGGMQHSVSQPLLGADAPVIHPKGKPREPEGIKVHYALPVDVDRPQRVFEPARAEQERTAKVEQARRNNRTEMRTAVQDLRQHEARAKVLSFLDG